MGASDISQVFARLRPGSHLCCLFETEDEHRVQVTCYVQQGLEKGERVLYIVDAHTAETIRGYLYAEKLAVDDYIARQQLAILTVQDAYMRSGAFDPDKMIGLLNAETERTVAEGYPALRVTGEMSWALRGLPGADRLIEYESKLNLFIPTSKCIALCQYDRRKFSAEILLDVVSTHPMVVIGTECYDNFYYMPTSHFLQRAVPEKTFRFCLENLRTRKKAEQQLHQAAQYTRSLIEASLDPLVTISREGKITDVNQATESATGHSRESLIGSDFSDYFTDPEKARRGYQQAFAEGSVQDFPLAIRHVSGRVMEVLYNASVFKNEAGQVEGVFAAARDISQRKQAEEEVRKLNWELEERVERRTAQLRESEERVRRKLESILSPEGDLGTLELADILDIPAVQAMVDDLYKMIQIPMAIIDLKGTFLVSVGLQEVCTKFHRVHPDSCRNCIESDVQLTEGVAPGKFRSYRCKNNMWDVVTPILVGGKHLANLFTGQFLFAADPPDYGIFRAQAKQYGFDEAEYLAALEKAPRLTRERLETSMSFFMKFAQMLSQLSYSSVKLARAMTATTRINAQLEVSVKELEAFTYSVSHDLRAPLRHISGFSKILTEEFGSSLPAEAQHHLLRIQEGTRRMGVLVDDLLKLARVGRRDLSMGIAGLNSLVAEVINELQPEWEGRRVEWRVAELPYVECDSGLIKQVLQNLIANALKFTRPRAQSVIEIGQQEEAGVPLIYVRDNGVGFSMKYADKLFGVFQRLHRTEEFEGTGVGLATVQRIIQKHGGRIWAEAELDKGATFYFTLSAEKGTSTNPKQEWQEIAHDRPTNRNPVS